jgi:hypothetical protein
MTTYSYQVTFDDSEIIAIKSAFEFYLTAEVQELLSNKDTKFANYYHTIKRLIDTNKLYESIDMTSTSSFCEREIKLK